jgi:hypothetical protein
VKRLRSWWWEWAETLKAEARARLGFPAGDELLAYLISWSNVEDELGHPPSHEEYVRTTHLGAETATLYRTLFSEAFPNLENPSHLLASLERQIDSQRTPLLFGVDDPAPG